MPVELDERQQYAQFLIGVAKELGSLEVNFGETLWHYTTGTSLLAILNSNRLYATQVSCLNDSTEVRYGTSLLREAFVSLQAEESLQENERNLLAEIVRNTTQTAVMPINAASKWFVTCFSQQRDDLSQWRAYSGGENGFAIGFTAGGFFRLGARHNIVRLNYNGDLHRSLAIRIARATLRFFGEGLAKRSDADAQQWPQEFLAEWDMTLSYLTPMVKDPAFRTEYEYRIMYELTLEDLPNVVFIQKSNLISRHLPLGFTSEFGEPPSVKLPIKEILVGPSRHKEISAVSVHTLLRQKGYDSVAVNVSAIPFQST
jgi:hypothetical protein